MITSPNIHQRLHKVMQAVSYIQKGKPKGMNYSIVSHDAVTAKVRPHLVEAGIVYYPVRMSYRQDGNRTEVQLDVRFANIDNAQDFIDVPALGFGVDPSDKGPGKAVSYAVKYALLKTLGLETGDDPDLEETEHEPMPARPSAPVAPEPQPGGALELALVWPDGKRMVWDKLSDWLTNLERAMRANPAGVYQCNVALITEVEHRANNRVYGAHSSPIKDRLDKVRAMAASAPMPAKNGAAAHA